ncbi:hypothetical protein FACS1894125_1050 [Actinomycetota bacterium]|nr:hypothetical protein FACS1894125_1050 [Actinomycetota bacterium]
MAIVDFYLSQYRYWTFEHFIDHVNEFKPENTPACFWKMSDRTVKRIIVRNNFKSPQANKPQSVKDIHPVRYKRENLGELIQLDASIHDWLETDSKITLHLAIDDATSAILATYFDKEETLWGYHNVFYQILINYGIPNIFYTDKRTVFEYKSSKRDEDTFTQFSRACSEVGVKIITTSVAQAKGRVERSFRTHQSRLINEMCKAGIKTIDAANESPVNYIKRHNAKFAKGIAKDKTVFRKRPRLDQINKLLSVQHNRTILNGNVVSIGKKQYLPMKNDKIVKLLPNLKVTVIRTFDRQLLLFDRKEYYRLECVSYVACHSTQTSR